MTTQELKNKIEKVLGNNIRCLLPSYWWKNLFHSVADRIDEVEQKIDGIEIPDGLPIVSSIAELDSLNLNKGRVASVVDGIGFSQCYQPTDEELSSLASSEELYSKLTRVENIDIKNNPLEEGEVGAAVLVDFRGKETELSYLVIVCVKQDGLTLKYAQGVISGQDVILLLSPGNIERLNKILSEYDMRFLAAKLDGLFEGDPEASLAALDKEFAINIDVDVYIKGGSWERLAKERDLEGIGGGTINANCVEIRELHISQLKENDTITQENQLTDEQKAYNLETLELARQNKAITSVSINNARFLLYAYGEKTFEGSALVNSSLVLGLFVAASIDDQGNCLMKLSIYGKDNELSDTSENVVQNQAIKSYVDSAITNLTNEMVANEKVHAAAYSDFNSRLAALEAALSSTNQ